MNALMLFTRDLRIEDNATLAAAAKEETLVCGVLTQDVSNWGESKRQFYQDCLAHLASSLELLGHKLYIIDDLSDFDIIYCSHQYNVDDQELLSPHNVRTIAETTLLKLKELPFTIAELPKTFTPFRHKADKLDKLPDKPIQITRLPPAEQYDATFIIPNRGGGELAAQERLINYFNTDCPLSYFDTRNGLIEYNDSTKFSRYLAWGCLSANQIYYHLKLFEAKHGNNKSTYWIFFELLWRDYFKFLSLKFGPLIFSKDGTAKRPLKRLDKSLEYSLFQQWCNAETEEPFVNANMRELNQTGWMSNRGRQNVASFLCKTKGVDWQLGAEYFANHLIDYDVESNYGNWAYLAGVGVDPRDRLFNIKRQAQIYDPESAYQQLWLK